MASHEEQDSPRQPELATREGLGSPRQQGRQEWQGQRVSVVAEASGRDSRRRWSCCALGNRATVCQ